MRAKRFFGDAYLAFVLCLLYLPILLVIIFSFSGNATFAFTRGLTLDSYKEIFTSDKSDELGRALTNTLSIAAISSVVSTVFGTFAAIGLFYLGKKAKRAAMAVNQLPLTNSEMVMAISLMLFFAIFISSRSFASDYVIIVVSHVSFCTPYVVLSVIPRLTQMNPNLYEAALDLGATPLQALFKVIIPYIFPGIVSGFVMAFTISMDDFIITQINKGSNGLETLSTFIYSDTRVGNIAPFWFAMFSIIFVVVLGLLLVANIKKINKKLEEKI